MNIYFSGIGGVGIGPLAEIAQDAGYGVQGSDTSDSLQLQRIKDRGIPVSKNQDGTFLQSCHNRLPVDLLIHTSALPANHPELVLAKKLGIKTAKRDELISKIITDKHLRLIAIAGTHGKTTTTAMLVWTMKQLGIPISYSVGAPLSFGPSGAYNPESEYFVYECDEFDRNFLHFSPYLSLITNVGFDHPDTYKDETDYQDAFKRFMSQSSMTILWKDADLTPHNGWVLPTNITDPAFSLPGEHNRNNAVLAAKAIEYLDFYRYKDAVNILNRFPGVSRRFERLASGIYSDYAHHPIEIAATLQLANELSNHVVAVYQPHQNIRQHEIQNLYTNCFASAEHIYWLPTYLSREDPKLPILSPEDLYKNLSNAQNVESAELDDALWQKIKKAQKEGKLVLAMGAGSIDAWLRENVKN